MRNILTYICMCIKAKLHKWNNFNLDSLCWRYTTNSTKKKHCCREKNIKCAFFSLSVCNIAFRNNENHMTLKKSTLLYIIHTYISEEMQNFVNKKFGASVNYRNNNVDCNYFLLLFSFGTLFSSFFFRLYCDKEIYAYFK